MRARETKAIPSITPGSPPNETRNPPCLKQSCKNQPNDFIISFPLVLLLVPLSKTAAAPEQRASTAGGHPFLKVCPPRPAQLGWAGTFPGISMMEPSFSPHSSNKNALQLPSKRIIPALAIIRFWGRCFVMLLWSFPPSLSRFLPAG